MQNELIILIAWHKEKDQRKIECFEENRKSFEKFNPGVPVISVISPFKKKDTAWLNSDLTLFLWFKKNDRKMSARRYLLVEWDCWCDLSIEKYFSQTWNMDVVAPCVKYPERDSWGWFRDIASMPREARLFATGIVPFSGILLSYRAMEAISEKILQPEYEGLNSELRFATIATMLGFDPVPNPVSSRAITWRTSVPFDKRYPGLHHPRKVIPSKSLDRITHLMGRNKNEIPKILHQTWKDDSPPIPYTKIMSTWADKHPEWERVLWTDEMNRAFIEVYYPEFILQYDSYEYPIQRVDAVRYFILHAIGGVFIDLDFECFKNIEPLLDGHTCAFALEPEAHCKQFGFDKIICNAFMAARPNHPFFAEICDKLPSHTSKNTSHTNNILYSTGPFALTKIYDSWYEKDDIKILEAHTVYPLSVQETRKAMKNMMDGDIQEKIDNAYAVHYFFGSWYQI